MEFDAHKKYTVRLRSIISLMTTWMFPVMAVTGLVLYFVPQGRVAYWVDWRFAGLTKTEWGNLHIVSSVLFAVFGGWHLYLNWRALLGHLRQKVQSGFRIKKELYITAAATLFIAVSAPAGIPPLGWLIDLNAWVKDAWIGTPEDEPPFGHAELLSLNGFCEKMNIEVDAAMAALKAKGIRVDGARRTLAAIAVENNISPKDVYRVIRGLKKTAVRAADNAPLTPDEILERFEGSGIGKKTTVEACQFGGGIPAECMERLAQRQIFPSAEETMKQAANQAGVKPIQLLQMMLIDRAAEDD